MRLVYNSLVKLSSVLNRIMTSVSSVILILWIFVIVFYVFGRYLGLKIYFVEEYTEYWLVFIAMFSLAYGVKQGAHISIDLIPNILPSGIRKVLDLIVTMLSLYVVSNLLNYSIAFLLKGIKYKNVSIYPSNTLMWPIYLIIPIGYTMMILELIIEIIKNFNNIAIKQSKQGNKIKEGEIV